MSLKYIDFIFLGFLSIFEDYLRHKARIGEELGKNELTIPAAIRSP